ncbi:lipocalin 11 [Cricetulus griseus]
MQRTLKGAGELTQWSRACTAPPEDLSSIRTSHVCHLTTTVEGKSHMQVQLSSVKDHWMLYCDGELEGMSFAVTQLIGRDLKENLEALEEFKEFTQKKGLIPENLVVPEQMGENTMLPSLSPVSPVTLSLLRPLSPMWTLQALLQRDVHLLQASLHTLGTHLAVHAGPGALPMLAHSLGHCSYDPFTSSHLTQTQEVTGHWSTLNLASTDRSVIEEGGAYQCFMTGIALLDNGNLNVTYLHRQDGKCVKEFYVAEKTGIPGRYTFDYQGKNYLTFVAVTEEFTIMDLENQSEGNTLIVVELHGVMTLARGWLLLLAFNIDLAQKTLREVPVQPDFEAHEVEGRWFTIQLATSHRDLVLPTDPLRLSLHSIRTRDSGDVDFVLFEKSYHILDRLGLEEEEPVTSISTTYYILDN